MWEDFYMISMVLEDTALTYDEKIDIFFNYYIAVPKYFQNERRFMVEMLKKTKGECPQKFSVKYRPDTPHAWWTIWYKCELDISNDNFTIIYNFTMIYFLTIIYNIQGPITIYTV